MTDDKIVVDSVTSFLFFFDFLRPNSSHSTSHRSINIVIIDRKLLQNHPQNFQHYLQKTSSFKRPQFIVKLCEMVSGVSPVIVFPIKLFFAMEMLAESLAREIGCKKNTRNCTKTVLIANVVVLMCQIMVQMLTSFNIDMI